MKELFRGFMSTNIDGYLQASPRYRYCIALQHVSPAQLSDSKNNCQTKRHFSLFVGLARKLCWGCFPSFSYKDSVEGRGSGMDWEWNYCTGCFSLHTEKYSAILSNMPQTNDSLHKNYLIAFGFDLKEWQLLSIEFMFLMFLLLPCNPLPGANIFVRK